MTVDIARLFPSESGVSASERGTSTAPFLIADAAGGGPKQFPWARPTGP